MDFHSAIPDRRPVRLSAATRSFALESLQGRYGDEAMRTPAVTLDDIAEFDKLAPVDRYNHAIRRIAQRAPIRICDHEQVSGAATLGLAIKHVVPATYGGEPVCSSISHFTPSFEQVVRHGLRWHENRIKQRLASGNLNPQQQRTLQSMQLVIDAICIWHARYREALHDKRPDLDGLLAQVPFGPARDFAEAVQSLWFIFAFIRLCGNWPGIGRLDVILGDYLNKDLAAGKLTIDQAREILAGFLIKGCEWIRSAPETGSGDAQHYQNIVLGGIDEQGKQIDSTMTKLVLDIVEELGISDFPVAVRLNEQTPPHVLARMAQVIRYGGGVIAAYNEQVVLDALERFGYTRREARAFANDGCWEVQIPGKTFFRYVPFDGLAVLQHETLRLQGKPACFDSFEALYSRFRHDLDARVGQVTQTIMQNFLEQKTQDGPWQFAQDTLPSAAVDLLVEGCIEKARPYYAGGPVYSVVSPHLGGLADIANSLYALKHYVFDRKILDLDTFLRIVADDWQGHEPLRQRVRGELLYYGNDHDEVDQIAARILADFSESVQARQGQCPLLLPPGVSTFGRQLEWAAKRTASPHGAKQGDVLAGNQSPTPGTDQMGATAVIKSYCKADLRALTCGTALDIRLHPSSVSGENGTQAISSLLQGFVSLGGFFMQLDVLDDQVLLQARTHPERYKTLAVRVSGWSARFVTLDEHWQDMIIARTAAGL